MDPSSHRSGVWKKYSKALRALFAAGRFEGVCPAWLVITERRRSLI